MMHLKKVAVAVIAAAGLALSNQAVHAQDTVKIGQIEALTGATATYGWMSAQGTKVAVEEINACNKREEL
jgi:branched-chain amino acid transport system substrate-binding protein